MDANSQLMLYIGASAQLCLGCHSLGLAQGLLFRVESAHTWTYRFTLFSVILSDF
jgi:hypothetical protein